jgi:hypothetical protein
MVDRSISVEKDAVSETQGFHPGTARTPDLPGGALREIHGRHNTVFEPFDAQMAASESFFP